MDICLQTINRNKDWGTDSRFSEKNVQGQAFERRVCESLVRKGHGVEIPRGNAPYDLEVDGAIIETKHINYAALTYPYKWFPVNKVDKLLALNKPVLFIQNCTDGVFVCRIDRLDFGSLQIMAKYIKERNQEVQNYCIPKELLSKIDLDSWNLADWI